MKSPVGSKYKLPETTLALTTTTTVEPSTIKTIDHVRYYIESKYYIECLIYNYTTELILTILQNKFIWSCSFDDIITLKGTFCDLEYPLSEDSHRFQWKLLDGATPSRPTGPETGVRGNGFYIYLEASRKEKGDYALLV